MTKTIKYCRYPVEDGRCGNPFSTYSIRSQRKFCDEHEPTQGVRAKSGNLNSKTATQEEMKDYLIDEMNSQELSRKELNDKMIRNKIDLSARIDKLHDIVADITNSDMEGYTIKKHNAMKEIIHQRIDVLFEQEKLNPINKEDRIMLYISKLSSRITTLEKDLDKAYEVINRTKKGHPIKRSKLK
tara:strand:+ start:1037 stop:1591 length:555 start_codon:yes stop_codon:yes gene_type:complete